METTMSETILNTPVVPTTLPPPPPATATTTTTTIRMEENTRIRSISAVTVIETSTMIETNSTLKLSIKTSSMPESVLNEGEDNSEEIQAAEVCCINTEIGGWQAQECRDRMFWAKGFKYCSSGGLIFIDKEIQKRQQGVVKEMLLQFGSQVVSGKVDTTISLPVRVFEPHSMLERVAGAWRYAPTLLAKAAAETSNPTERLKYVASFVIGGLHFCLGQLKPFNPILGETYQSQFPDGTLICMEHICHHPPVCAFALYGADNAYTLSGKYEFTASMKGNAFVSAQSGNAHIDFKDGTRITYTIPHIKMSGLLVGNRQVEWLGEAKFLDIKNKLECLLTLNPPSSLFGKSVKSDEIKGSIRSIQKKGAVPIASIEGSWLSHLAFDGKKYWELKTEPVYPLLPTPNPLPSDSSFRSDLVSLANGNEEEAQGHKLKLEALQRSDRKLRTTKKK